MSFAYSNKELKKFQSRIINTRRVRCKKFKKCFTTVTQKCSTTVTQNCSTIVTQEVAEIAFSNSMFILLKSQIQQKMTFSNSMHRTKISDLTKNAFF